MGLFSYPCTTMLRFLEVSISSDRKLGNALKCPRGIYRSTHVSPLSTHTAYLLPCTRNHVPNVPSAWSSLSCFTCSKSEPFRRKREYEYAAKQLGGSGNNVASARCLLSREVASSLQAIRTLYFLYGLFPCTRSGVVIGSIMTVQIHGSS